MIEDIGSLLRAANIGNEGDGIDRLHFKAAPAFMMLMAAFAMLIKYTGLLPLVCYVPANFGKSWIEYTTWFCYVNNTYRLKHGDIFESNDIIAAKANGDTVPIKYYQWVPVIFAGIAVIFYIPRFFWQAVLESSGVAMTSMVNSVNGFESALDPSKRHKSIMQLVKFLDAHFEAKRAQPSALKLMFSKFCVCFSRSNNAYLATVYVMIKAFEVINVCAMFVVLNAFLGDGYHFYGFVVIKSLIDGTPYINVNRFPLQTLCDTNRYDFAVQQPHTFQCVLTLNVFNDKLFLVIWFFLLYVGILTIMNAVGWVQKLFIGNNRRRYISGILRLSDNAEYDPHLPEDQSVLNSFVTKYLRADGVFTFRIINANTTTVVMHEIIGELWNLYKKKPFKAQLAGGLNKLSPGQRDALLEDSDSDV